MKEKNKKKILAIAFAVVALVVVGTTYAFITQTLTGSKKVTITARTLSLVLNEGNAITISDALPMYDQVGMIQEKSFNFSLVNNTSNDTNYVLKLVKIDSANELQPSIVKYYLTKEGIGQPALLSSLTDGIIDTGTITGNDTIDYTLRLWIDSEVTDQTLISGKSLSYRIDVEASMVEEKQTVTFAGITKEVNETVDAMFNYTSEGKYISDYDEQIEETDENYITNGIYRMDDDDGPSYFYRGEVTNLVKFGSYTKDYYVYRYGSYDFPSLEACQYYSSNCSESNKVLKYAASDIVPMYWRIVRVNGDGTIRMIYAGTTPDATGYDTGIGISRYNEGSDDPKYVGYTYDRTIKETKSNAKTEIDNWYKNVFEGTEYDGQIVTGKFCSDSSGYEEVTDVYGDTFNAFGPEKRLFPKYYNLEGNSTPSFQCAVTSETYGGSYNLKAGLIASDEIVAAGGQMAPNNSYYLYNGTKGNDDGNWFWSMSPAVFGDGVTFVGGVNNDGSACNDTVDINFGLLRPVINLRSDISFKSGTDGSTTSPYEIE